MRSREEHLQWCKQRALEYITAGDVQNAFASMSSDLGKHPETKGHIGMELGLMLMRGGHLGSPIKMKEFIEGFN